MAEDQNNKVNPRILLVEDNADVAEMLTLLLETRGYTVASALSGQDAIAQASEFGPDVVLCDLGLPDISGYDVARALRGKPDLADVLMFAVTGYGDADARQETRRAGFNGHLTKPVEVEQLEAAISAARS